MHKKDDVSNNTALYNSYVFIYVTNEMHKAAGVNSSAI